MIGTFTSFYLTHKIMAATHDSICGRPWIAPATGATPKCGANRLSVAANGCPVPHSRNSSAIWRYWLAWLKKHCLYLFISLKFVLPDLRSGISRNFRNARQEDAHEYMVNLLESMHRCCLPSGVPSESPGAYEKSLVHKIFGGRLRSQVTVYWFLVEFLIMTSLLIEVRKCLQLICNP